MVVEWMGFQWNVNRNTERSVLTCIQVEAKQSEGGRMQVIYNRFSMIQGYIRNQAKVMKISTKKGAKKEEVLFVL